MARSSRGAVNKLFPKVMRKLMLVSILIIFATTLLISCSSDPISVRDLEQTREAEIAEAKLEATKVVEERNQAIIDRAPEGTVFAAVTPETGHNSDIVIDLGTMPPMGGVHHPQWQQCKVYDEPIQVEHAVHALEHGGIWITYEPSITDDEVDQLGKFTQGEPFVMVSPYPNLESPIVVTAWGLQLSVDSAEDQRIQEFIDAYANGPQTPEPGASCKSGVNEIIES